MSMFAKMRGMVEGKDIYLMCTALASGALSAHFILETAPNPLTGYIVCAIAFPLLASFIFLYLTFQSMNGASGTVRGFIPQGKIRVLRHPILWMGIFFNLGAFCFSASHTVLGTGVASPFLKGIHGIVAATIKSIPFEDGENNAIVQALLLGDRDILSRDTVKAFRIAGASHFLALSGMHLGIIYAIVNRILAVAGNTPVMRRIRDIAVIAITLSYTLVCGASASLVRAWLFILISRMGHIFHRRQPLQQIYCSSLMIHICFQSSNVSDIGFQLSYLAMAGITFVWPHVRNWMSGRIWEAASLSVCCQLFTAPLTYVYFGTFPKYFLITNIVGAPLLTLALLSGLIACIINIINPAGTTLVHICELPIRALRSLMGSIVEMEAGSLP